MKKMRAVLVQRRSYVFLLISTLLVLVAGSLTIVWQVEQHYSTRADGSNVIGPPSLPSATVNTILTRAGSPMAGTGAVIEQAARQANIDDAFALAVWWTETNDGAAGVGRADHNPGGVRASPAYPAAADGYTIYPSYAAGVSDWFNVVKSRYTNRGLTTVYAISYPYVGTSGSGNWANKVVNLMLRYRGEAPVPTPIPTAKPKPVPHSHVQVQPESGFAASQHNPAQTTGKVQAATNSQPSSLVARIGQTMLVMLGLVIALLLFLWGKRTRQASRLSGASLPAWQAQIGNSVSSALKTITPSDGVKQRFEPISSYASSSLTDFSPMAPLPRQLPSLAELQPTAPMPVAPVASYTLDTDLLLSSRTTEVRLRRVTLLGRNGTASKTRVTDETNKRAAIRTVREQVSQSAPEPFVTAGAPGVRKGLLSGYKES
ncbi:MAG TPA: hypothetical protein VKY19_02055 [Ktedonosporobacter sp.]|jgi:hypothetical protein|nr:hypothetical protein [Ktedonosporobacter sp.]